MTGSEKVRLRPRIFLTLTLIFTLTLTLTLIGTAVVLILSPREDHFKSRSVDYLWCDTCRDCCRFRQDQKAGGWGVIKKGVKVGAIWSWIQLG